MARSSNISKLLVIIGLIIGLSFLYVWQKIEVFSLGYKIRAIQKQINKLQEENTVLHIKISTLLSPEHIEKEVKRLGLRLRPPSQEQIVRIKKQKKQ